MDPSRSLSETLQLLGCLFGKVLMKDNIDRAMGRVKPKVRALLPLKNFCPLHVMLELFKAHTRSLVDCHAGALPMLLKTT